MTETEENMNVEVTYSKFTRVAFVVISMLLIFVGPTYVPYAMEKVNVNGYVISRSRRLTVHCRLSVHAVSG